jgi:hypothetical protein
VNPLQEEPMDASPVVLAVQLPGAVDALPVPLWHFSCCALFADLFPEELMDVSPTIDAERQAAFEELQQEVLRLRYAADTLRLTLLHQRPDTQLFRTTLAAQFGESLRLIQAIEERLRTLYPEDATKETTALTG